MRVLHVSSEAKPWSQTGGLGDVAGALPAALRRLGVEAHLVTPRYGFVETAGFSRRASLIRLGQATRSGALLAHPEGHTFFVDLPGLLDRPELYGPPGGAYRDNNLRFAWFCRAALPLAADYDVVHCHDWQAAPLAAYLGGQRPVVLTVHNLAYQGHAPLAQAEALELDRDPHDGAEFYGRLNLLKGGLVAADRITTVSPRYAREIMDEPGGQGLAGVLGPRASQVRGILNGIDTESFDPSRDPALAHPFSVADPGGKSGCRRELLAGARLPAGEGPLFGVVSRATWQKGLDLLLGAAGDLIRLGGRLVMVTDGEPALIEALGGLVERYPERVALCRAFNDALARRVYAGSDFILVPSRFEPCGLSQLIAMRYGAIPIVRATGGLADTVIDGETGLCFGPPDAGALGVAIERAVALYGDRPRFNQIRRACMARDWSWGGPAAEYRALYEGLLLRGVEP